MILQQGVKIGQLKCSYMDIFKHILDSTHSNLNSMNQVPYLLEIHLTNDQNAMDDDNNPIIFKDIMICI